MLKSERKWILVAMSGSVSPAKLIKAGETGQ